MGLQFGDPIPGLLEFKDRHGNRVGLLLGLRGMDPELLNRTRRVRRAGARAVIDLERRSLDLELLRRLAERFGRDAVRAVEQLIGRAGLPTVGADADASGLLGSVAGPRYQRIRSERPLWAVLLWLARRRQGLHSGF